MSIIPALQWRYATKKMNGEKVSQQNINSILESARLAPTSSGLQPFEMIVISNQALKEKIKPLAYNQSQITDCSHLIVFAAWNHYSIDRINHYFDHYEKERDLPKGFSEGYKNGVTKQLTAMTLERQFEHAARQVYIALGMALTEAGALEVDSIPMEGFVNHELDLLLDLEAKGLKSVVIMPVGYRDAENDWQAEQKKVRKTSEDMITFIE
ncbi:NAD(P)H-dependent oxidoreductase [Flavobacterium sp. xlx-214]|uniref:NAD(P)H-dependent oxidoreductase n=1 Tax=unclassified Flavobacterium TaxID=196869 RepID=UPI0013D23C32|nr:MULTISPECIES: NAD(P)H-dependent oxidoreductase [unclassified Flavobacterium]MBA5793685.1 NAD(P)H-dependent oxidoreductase [Flavobacterium sp. xlx-221]QMI83291.1 NAD(P)H-dependent oxidoreductase [Flavobacterium sp. xlx-214]